MVHQGLYTSTDGMKFIQGNSAVMTFKLGSDGQLPASCVLLNNQSTIDVLFNNALLMDIRTSDTCMDIHYNAGIVSTNLIGDLLGYGTVWYHPKGIANILLLSQVLKRGFHVTFQADVGTPACHVHNPNGTQQVFCQINWGLFYTDITADPGLSEIALIKTR
jgi:hypothetical protein